jgi:hypothetical protein
LDRVRHKIRLKHYSIRTEQAYISWIKRYIHFHDLKHPKDMGEMEISVSLISVGLCPAERDWEMALPDPAAAGQSFPA